MSEQYLNQPRAKCPLKCSLALLLLALLVLSACAEQPTRASAGTRVTPSSPAVYPPTALNTSTPTLVPASATVPRPTATFVPLITPSATATGEQLTRADVPRIDVATAKTRVEAGEAILVDVRTRATYEAQHIAGAMSMPADQVARRVVELPDDKLIIFYCA